MKSPLILILLSVLSVKVSAQAPQTAPRTQTAPPTAQAPASSPAPATAQVAPMDDAQAAHVAVTINKLEIDAAQVALKKAKNSQVRDFARMMVTEHRMTNQKITRLVTSEKIRPEGNNLSTQMKKDGESDLKSLNSAQGAEFDRMYIEAQVKAHQKVLNALDITLIPNSSNPQMRSLLQATRDQVAGHLAQAQTIRSSLTQ